MTEKEIAAALRCISTAGGGHDCEHCLYWRKGLGYGRVLDYIGVAY